MINPCLVRPGACNPPPSSRAIVFGLLSLILACCCIQDSSAQTVPMLTYHNNNARLGANTNETALTLANVNTNSFGKLFSHSVDGYVYAQPLVLTNVSVPGKGVHHVVYVVTEHESVYAFDADSASGSNSAPLWQVSFLNPAAGVTTVPSGDVGSSDIVPEIGITSTPVIDPLTGTIYIEAKTKENASYVHRLHALDVSTGAEKFGGPVTIQASVPGTGDGNNGAGQVPFNSLRQMNRPGLALLNNIVYIAYASHGDQNPYHGWLLGYNATNVSQQLKVFNSTPNGGRGGFWQGGGAPAIDSAGNIYLITGNGTFNAGTATYGDSFLKISTSNALSLTSYFTPFDEAMLNSIDADLGSGASIVLPDSVGSTNHPRLLVGGGKGGKIYLLDRDNLGGFNASGDTQIVQVITNALGSSYGANGSYSTPAFFNNTLYYIGSQVVPKAFRFSNGLLLTNPVSQASTDLGHFGSTPTITANGTNNAILWALQNNAAGSSGPAVLRAFNATNLTLELYNSNQLLSRDNPGPAVKFAVPTVVNGKVYAGAQYALSVYGSGTFLATPVIAPNGGVFTNSVTVSISSATPGAAIYYTLDGTVPSAASTLFTGPFSLTNSTVVRARAFKAGFVDSSVVSATFINSSAIGNGTGLSGAYYSNRFTTNAFTGSPTLVRTDATVNFNWGSGAPAPTISTDHFTVRWTGSVQPQFTEPYTFHTTTDDGVRLWVNGQLLIDKWIDQGSTEWSGTTSNSLTAQQRYNVVMEFYENGGAANASLAWSSPTTTKVIIPQSQLYPTSNQPPVVVLTSPTNNASYTALASLTLGANAADPEDVDVDKVDFYLNNIFVGTVSNAPYRITTTGVAAGAYAVKAVASDGAGYRGTSAPVNITVLAGSAQPYGLVSRAAASPFLNMPSEINSQLPAKLSLTGVFSDTPNLIPVASLLPYDVNVALWSDAALKTRWLAVPNNGAPYTPDEQVGFAATGEWTFPTGTIFVKHFELVTAETNPVVKRRLETRLLVRDPNGGVYGLTYKWRADYSDADLLTNSLTEDITITNSSGVRTQTWYYPSPTDCLTCHTPAAGYVLGVKTRQLNGNFAYPSTGQTDNQLRTFNRIGLLDPAINEADINALARLAALTNLSASLEHRARSYLDANCAQCHRPGGTGTTLDARFDTPLANQHLINEPLVNGDLGLDNARVVVPKDIWRSVLYARMESVNPDIKMPTLARNLVDTNALQVIGDWINSLTGTPALAPPTITPPGGSFPGSVSVTFQHPRTNATLRYTLDSSLPTTNSTLYSGNLLLTSNSTARVKAFENGFIESVAANATFTVRPPIYFTSGGQLIDGQFHVQLSGLAGKNYFFQASSNLFDWSSLSTNFAASNVVNLTDPGASNYQRRFYRALEQP